MKMLIRICLGLMLLLLPGGAMAEGQLTLSTEVLAAESVLDFSITGVEAASYTYTLYLEGEELFCRETDKSWGSYVPRKSGDYTLEAALPDGEALLQANFTVTEKLLCTLPELPKKLKAGEPLVLSPQAIGGTGSYTYVFAVISPDGTSKAWKAGPDWHWVPEKDGHYTIRVTVEDTAGARATAQTEADVIPGAGLSLTPNGGALLAHGGQQSWLVYAPGDWTAATADAFLTLNPSSGVSGQPLCVTITEPTATLRQGSVTITSGSCSITWPVNQSASQGVDEEISLLSIHHPVKVEGETHFPWLNADGAKTFTVTAEEAWTATTENDFIHVEATAEGVTLSVDEPLPGAARHGVVQIATDSSAAYIHVYQPSGALPLSVAIAVELPPEEANSFTLYSQSCGLWQEKPYGNSNLQQSGCAIFALSHALQRLGFEGEQITPEYLAAHYAFALREGGTINSTLVGNVGDDLGYKTRYELYDSLPVIRRKMQEGALFSFAVVNGHIAMVAGMNEDGTMFHIIDSAPSATWERIRNAQLFRQAEDGSFTPISDLTELEGIRYYIETDAFGGTEYWLEADYIARRGLRLIQKIDK